MAGSTWTPSTIMPNHTDGDSSAAAIGPGSRLASGRMALKRWVKPVRPSANGGARLRVGRDRMPQRDPHTGRRQLFDEARRHLLGREGHQRDAMSGLRVIIFRSSASGRRSALWIMHTRAFR